MNNPPDDAVPLTKFMLETAENFHIAHAIHVNYNAARKELLDQFFKKLATDLCSTHPDWKYDWGNFFVDQFPQFRMGKPAWDWRYVIEIQAQGYGNRMVYGVWRDDKRLSSVPRDPVLHDLVRKKVSGNIVSRPWYEAEIELISPARDWRLPEVLWRTHSDPTFLQEVASMLRELATLVEKRVDELVEKLG